MATRGFVLRRPHFPNFIITIIIMRTDKENNGCNDEFTHSINQFIITHIKRACISTNKENSGYISLSKQ